MWIVIMWIVLVLLLFVVVGSVQSGRERARRRTRIARRSAVRRRMGRVPPRTDAQGRIAGTFRATWSERKGGHRDTAAPYRLDSFFPHR